MTKRGFNKILLEAVDEGLSSPGESAKQAIYFHLENRFNIKKNEIPSKLKAFNDGIEEIFGAGANFLKILKSLYEKVGIPFEWHEPKSFDFIKCVAFAPNEALCGRRKQRKYVRELFHGK